MERRYQGAKYNFMTKADTESIKRDDTHNSGSTNRQDTYILLLA